MNTPVIDQFSKARPLFEYLKKQRENEKFMHYLEIAATFVLVTFFLVFAIRPTILTISSLVGDIKSKQLLKAELKTKINDVIRAEDLFSQVQDRYLVINTSLPDKAYYTQTADQIRQSALASGLLVDNFGFSLQSNKDKSIDPNVSYYSVGLNIQGQFNSAIKMVTDLLNNRRLININSISVNNGRSDNANATTSATQNQVGTNFGMSFYYWPANSNEK